MAHTSSSVTQTSPSPVQHLPHAVQWKLRPSEMAILKGKREWSVGVEEEEEEEEEEDGGDGEEKEMTMLRRGVMSREGGRTALTLGTRIDM